MELERAKAGAAFWLSQASRKRLPAPTETAFLERVHSRVWGLSSWQAASKEAAGQLEKAKAERGCDGQRDPRARCEIRTLTRSLPELNQLKRNHESDPTGTGPLEPESKPGKLRLRTGLQIKAAWFLEFWVGPFWYHF